MANWSNNKKPYSEITISLPHLTISGKQWGDRTLPVLLGFHGWVDNCATFDKIAPLIRNYSFIAVDLQGHGKSSHLPEGMIYHFADYVTTALALIDTLNLKKLSLVGHSMGAGVALMVAAVIPKSINKLVLIEGLGPFTDTPENAPKNLYKSYRQGLLLKKEQKKLYKSPEEALQMRQLKSPWPMNEDSLRLIIDRGVKKVSGGYTWSSDSRLMQRSPFRYTEEQINAFLRAIDAPTLLIEGNPGMEFPVDMIKKRCSHIRNLTHSVVSGGHHLHLDNHEEVAQEINTFLQK